MATDNCKQGPSPMDAREDDCDHNLNLAYFDSSQDDDACFRHQKPVSAKDAEIIRLRGVTQ